VSDTRTSSPALTELLADVVIVNRLARLGHNTVHTIHLVEEFNRHGVHFRALDLGIDSRTPAGKLIIAVFASFKQYNRLSIRRTKSSKAPPSERRKYDDAFKAQVLHLASESPSTQVAATVIRYSTLISNLFQSIPKSSGPLKILSRGSRKGK
jgi:hypothetical protein